MASSTPATSSESQALLVQTTQTLVFTISQNGFLEWAQSIVQFLTSSDAALDDASSSHTDASLEYANEVYNTAVIKTITPLVESGRLDSSAATILHKAFFTLAVKSQLGLYLGPFLSQIVSTETFALLTSPSTPSTTEKSRIYATAWMAFLYLFLERNAVSAWDRLMEMLKPLVLQASFLLEEVDGDVDADTPSPQWPSASFANLIVDTSKHVAQACHLQAASISTQIPPPTILTPLAPAPSSTVPFLPSQIPYQLRRRKPAHGSEPDYRASKRAHQMQASAKAKSVKSKGRRSNRENIAPPATRHRF